MILFVLSIAIWIIPFIRPLEFIIFALIVLGFVAAVRGAENTTPGLSEASDHIFNNLQQSTRLSNNLFKESAEERLLKTEEKKLSALYHRIEEDEKQIESLKEEVAQLKKKQ